MVSVIGIGKVKWLGGDLSMAFQPVSKVGDICYTLVVSLPRQNVQGLF